jgi:hypothetical protein
MSYAIFNATIVAVQTAKRSLVMVTFEHLKLESCYTLITKVVQNVTITALAKIQHFCIRNERTTEFPMSVGRLPKQLSNFPQFAFFGHAKWKFAVRLKANFEAYEMWYLLIVLKNGSMNLILDTRYPVTVAAIVM